MKNVLRAVITILLLAVLPRAYAQYPACPQVITNPVGIVSCGQTCVDLTATAEGGYATTSYTYASVAFAPPVAFNVGTQLNLHIDDGWSGVINLPFTFCFFGTAYTEAIFSSNGSVGFNAGNAGAGSNWEIFGAVPASVVTNGETDLYNTINGPWQDLDNTNQGTIWSYLGGTAPCRFFAASWYNCAMYGDAESVNTDYCTNTDHQYQQIVIYETSNVIDINIQAKAVPCDNEGNGYWNGGLAVEGLINANASTFVGPAARNATIWNATNDAMRFTPNGTPTYTITWFQGTTQIGTGSPFQVCPTGPTTYTAKATYSTCGGGSITVSDSVFVNLASLTVSDSAHQPTCGNNNGSVYANFNANSGIISYGWAPGGAGDSTLHNLAPGTYVFTVTDSAGCTARDTEVLAPNGGLTVTVANDTVNSCTNSPIGTLIANVTGGTGPFAYVWSNTDITDTITGLAAGTYTVTVTATGGCSATASGTVVFVGGTNIHIVTLALVNDACYGGNTGEIKVTGSSGSPPYTYNWSNIGAGPDSIIGLIAGTYSVTVTDRFGCTADSAYNITQGPQILFNPPVITNVTCAGDSNGSITDSATGGTGPLSYAWSVNNDSTPTASNLPAGTYSLTVTDSLGCTATASYQVTAPPPIIDTAVLDSATCSAGGAIIIHVGGGTPPYTFSWSNLASGDSIGGLAGGSSYTVAITDSSGCSITASFTVPTASNALTFGPPVIVEPACNGFSNGSITATTSGGTGTIKYSWSNIDSMALDSNLATGTYSVTISDSLGCSASTSYFLNQPTAVAITQAIVDSVTCFGGSNGSITVTAGGGTPPYSYGWSGVPGGPDLTDSATGLPAGGPYIITVTDSLGCSINGSYTIGQPTAITIDSAVITPEGCTSGGSIVVTASGGSGFLNYGWNNGGAGDSIGGLASGTYTLTITDQHGCSITASYFVPSVAGAITIDSVHITNVSCSSGSNGMIIVFASDSTGGPISYLWSNLSTSDTASNLINGTYCVTVTDSLGCSASACYHISEPNPIIILSPTLTEPLCNGDSNGCILASAIGGTGTIVFTWSNNGFVGDTDCGLAAGIYGVTATDSLGCSASTTFTLGQPTPDSVTAIVSNVTCNGFNNGSITAFGSGGSGGFTYTWTGGLTGQTISGLDTGTYCVTATDANGCSATACFTVTQPPALVINGFVTTPVTCATLGTDSVSTSGGTGTLTYLWSNGGTTALITGLTAQSYCVTVSDSLSCSVSACDTVLNSASVVVIDSVHIDNVTCIAGGSIIVYASGGNTGLTYTWSGTSQTGDSIGNLAASTYCVTVADSTGCSASACYTLNPPAPLTINAVVDSDRCHGDNTGSIILTVTGNGPVIYIWAPNVSSNDTALGLTAGPYCVVATDSLGCFQSACYTVNQPAAITQSGVVTNITCNNLGSIAVSASGGTGTLSIAWNPSTATGFNPTGLSAGQYIDSITDQNGCSSLDTFTVTGSGGNPPVITGATIDSVSCFGGNNGSITVFVSGGTPPLTYAWNNLEHTASDTGLIAGIFGVQVTDSVGCTVDGGPYTVSQPAAIVDSGLVTNATCSTGGAIQVFAGGGTGTLTYAWTGPSTATGSNPTGLSAGTYVVTITDQHGCTKVDSFTVSGSAGAITLTDSVRNVSCHGDTNGSITITATGGSNYVYVWSPNVGTGATVTGLGPGNYSVTVTGSGGCSASLSASITQPNALVITLTAPSVLCVGAHSVASLVVDSGGTGPYTYHWFNNGSTTTVDSVLQAGNVAVTVTDSLGCTASASNPVQQDLFALAPVVVNPNCANPIPTILVGFVVPPGTPAPPYTYTLDSTVSYTTSDSTHTFDSIFPGTYFISVKDGNGCVATDSVGVNTPPAFDTVSAHEIPSPCSAVNNGQVVVDVAPGDASHGPFTYSLNGGGFQSDSVFTGLATGSYTVVVHNNLGCNDTIGTPVTVTSDSVLTVTFTYDTIGPNPAPGAINSDTITLMPNVTGFTNPVYSWSPSTGLSCTSCPSPVVYATPSATVNGPIKYYVTVSDSLDPQCAAQDSIVIIPKGLFQMPDAFSPNGDGKNDLFGPVKYSYVTVTAFRIYNRWGQMVHNSADYWDGKFDGKDQPEGAYVYYIEVTYTNGFDYGNLITGKQEGSVILLR